LAHRLDRDTSGCLVLGRHCKALAQLGKLFKAGAIGKTYWAVVDGGPDTEDGQIELPLGRLDVSRGWWMKHDPCGQPAATKWQVLGRSARPTTFVASPLVGEAAERSEAGGGRQAGGPVRGQLTWLALEPLTGRTHQLRVHCAAMGWPIVGDSIYGDAPQRGGPILHLHAREIVVPLYKNRAPIRVVAPVPQHLRAALEECGWRDDDADAYILPRSAAAEIF
jgi:tRNA pseudouridine32 synthase/23S rRNA pseudouridine746 synthase